MAIDDEAKRRAAIDAGLPWKFPTVDPTEAGFESSDRAAALGLYGGFGGGAASSSAVNAGVAGFIDSLIETRVDTRITNE